MESGSLGGRSGLATGLLVTLFPAVEVGTGLLAGATGAGAAIGRSQGMLRVA